MLSRRTIGGIPEWKRPWHLEATALGQRTVHALLLLSSSVPLPQALRGSGFLAKPDHIQTM
jgi:hypothetical protein